MPEARVGALPERDLAELVGWLVELERYDELVGLCRDRLGAFARRADVEPLARFAAEALTDAEAYEPALEIAQAAFRQLNIAYHAYDAACHLARLDRPEEAMEWLRRAIDATLDCGAMLDRARARGPPNPYRIHRAGPTNRSDEGEGLRKLSPPAVRRALPVWPEWPL